MKKQVLLIGALGGLGSACVKELSNNEWHVFAADIKPEIFTFYENAENVTPLLMDITNAISISEALKRISRKTTGLDALINMAGILKIGSLLELPVSELEKSLEINLLGVYMVNKEFLPLVLQRKGRIIILSSEVGRQSAAPFNGVYSISKHAIEAYADALRRELTFLGVKVIKIQPGPFKTPMTKNVEQLFIEAQKDSTYFKKNLSKGLSYLPKVYKNAHDPIYAAKSIMKALTSDNPKTSYLIKPDLLRIMLDFLPVKLLDRIIKKFLS